MTRSVHLNSTKRRRWIIARMTTTRRKRKRQRNLNTTDTHQRQQSRERERERERANCRRSDIPTVYSTPATRMLLKLKPTLFLFCLLGEFIHGLLPPPNVGPISTARPERNVNRIDSSWARPIEW